jgi:hypothetical protein
LEDNMKMCGLEVGWSDELNSAPTERFLLCGGICSVPFKETFLYDQKACSKKDRTFPIKTLFYILSSSPLYWRYTVPNVSSIVGMLPGTHFSVTARSSLNAFFWISACSKKDRTF